MRNKVLNGKPILGITMGDPAGIGPEIAAKTLNRKKIYEMCNPIVIGDAKAMEQAKDIAKVNLEVYPVHDIKEAKFRYGTIDVYDLNNVDLTKLVHGKVSVMAGEAAFAPIKKVIELAMSGEIDGTVTGPINKESMNLAGHHFSGHTEIYAHYTNSEDSAMLLVHDKLRVVHVSTHVSLRQACDLVKKKRILKVINYVVKACKDLGVLNPKIGVAGLNPHASEGGLFGWEEEREIIPAVKEAKGKGFNIEGPIPPDTIFSKALGGIYDAVVAMYHDQGHIPVKVLGFRWNEKIQNWDSVSGVNITLGIPIIRASVDHGTAFDIAGKGKATDESLVNAIDYATKMVMHKK